MHFEPLQYSNKTLCIIDQTLLPQRYEHIELPTLESVIEAIKSLRVRGAPAIGICAAYGVLVGLDEAAPDSLEAAQKFIARCIQELADSRPTAVNLFWALKRMEKIAEKEYTSIERLRAALEMEAIAIHEEDKKLCLAIGDNGAPIIQEGTGVLTHCNAGGLATSGYGTALAVMFRAHELGTPFEVYADETRPLLQGARLTAWELQQAGIPVTLICDSMAAQVMREGRIQSVIVGADRVAANGDAANKIGTYGVALLAKAHNIPFYVAVPCSTIDPETPEGAAIPIEQRDPAEVRHFLQAQSAPEEVAVYNPAFDVTPAELITGIITDRGILYPPFSEAIAGLKL